MQNFSQWGVVLKTKSWVYGHKKTSIFIVLILLWGIWYTYGALTNTSGQTKYVLGNVTKGTIVSSVSGSGQVSTNHQLDVKPQVSANVIYIGHKQGDFVKRGDLIVELDPTNAQKSVRDAQANLDSAKISLAKLQEPTDAVTLLQTQNDLAQASSSLANDYINGLTTVSSSFIDLPNDINGVYNIIYGTDASVSTGQQRNLDFYANSVTPFEDYKTSNYGKAQELRKAVDDSYTAAKIAYDKNFTDYKNISPFASRDDINNLINETYTTSNLIAQSIRNMSNLIHYYQDTLTNLNMTVSAKSTSQLTLLNTYSTQVNGHINDLSSLRNSIINDSLAVPTKAAALLKLQNGTDVLDIQSAQLSVTKAQNALQDAKDNLSYYYVTAPFDGMIGEMSVKDGDPASPSTTVATMVADIDIANITLNEVDAAKIKIGEKVTLTFDAIDTLTLTGKVTKIDTVGTVSQGVVNYNVEITFDATDPRVKPGMSVSASIITEVHQDILTVPSSSVKSSGGQSYVEVLDTTTDPSDSINTGQGITSATLPTKKYVTTGLSSDTDTEIVSGLKENDVIITKTIAGTTASASTAPSILNSVGGTRATGVGATRSTGIRGN